MARGPKKVKEYEPDVLAYSIKTGEHVYHIELNQMVRSHYNKAISVLLIESNSS